MVPRERALALAGAQRFQTTADHGDSVDEGQRRPLRSVLPGAGAAVTDAPVSPDRVGAPRPRAAWRLQEPVPPASPGCAPRHCRPRGSSCTRPPLCTALLTSGGPGPPAPLGARLTRLFMPFSSDPIPGRVRSERKEDCGDLRPRRGTEPRSTQPRARATPAAPQEAARRGGGGGVGISSSGWVPGLTVTRLLLSQITVSLTAYCEYRATLLHFFYF